MNAHREVPSPMRATQRYQPVPDSIREARHLVGRALAQAGLHRRIEDVTLAVSELATNAVTHAPQGSFVVTLTHDDHHLDLAVEDANPEAPVLCSPEPTALGGRGIAIVAMLSDEWGVDPLAEGKRVWCRFSG